MAAVPCHSTKIGALQKGIIIRADAEDDVTSIRARLENANAARAALVLGAGHSLKSLVDFDRLRRAGRELGTEIAVVGGGVRARSMAQDAGLPTFFSLERATSAKWLTPDDFETIVRVTPPRRFAVNSLRRFFPTRNWFGIGLRVVIGMVTLVGLGGLGLLWVPTAKVTLASASRTITTIVPVTLDPKGTSVDLANRTVPAVRIESFIDGSASVPTTGKKSVASGVARGGVEFFSISSAPYKVPRGTVVSTSSGTTARFVTTGEVEVPPGGRGVAGVEALAEGGEGNAGANEVNQVEGAPSLYVSVNNPGPIGGGGGRDVNAVVQDDYKRVRAQLLVSLTQQAADRLQGEPAIQRDGLYVVPATVTIRDIQNETYDRFIGEAADQLRLDMRLQVVALAVAPANINAVARAALVKKVPAGFALADFEADRGDGAEEGTGTRSEFFITARGRVVAQVDGLEARRLIRGKTPIEAQNILINKYLLQRNPKIELGPDWFTPYFGRLPYTPVRITTEVVTVGDGN